MWPHCGYSYHMNTATTYSESAEGIEISHARAMVELKRHGINRTSDLAEMTDFYATLGRRTIYNASDVLAWLGY